MKKLERMRKLKEQMRNEDIENAKKTADEKGLGFVEYELPPDEVDEKAVRRSILTSIRTFIPYSNEWYEAMAAEEEMDDLRKIKIERVKADDLYTMAKMGRHEEALESMMAETNYDFFYFNKLKMKMEEEGKFKFVVPQSVNIFADFERTANRNRLKKAINQVNMFMDSRTTEELARLANMGGEGMESRKFTNEQPCVWRGKNKDGESVKCENPRMRKPEDPKKAKEGGLSQKSGESKVVPAEELSPSKKFKAEYYQFCCYHVPFCSSGNHVTGEQVKIKIPNSEGFCSECYMLKTKKRPPPLTCDICPGVVPMMILAGTKSGRVKSIMQDEEDVGEFDRAGSPKNKKRKNDLICQWIPSTSNEKLRAYECTNERLLDPTTNQRLTCCAWHLTKCIRFHPIGTNNIITIANPFGLCAMHYLSEQGSHAPHVEIPYPGMKLRQAKDFWKTLGRHFAVPTTTPPEIIIATEYEPPVKPDNIIDTLISWYKYGKYVRNYYRMRHIAVLKIQRCFRMYRFRRYHEDLYAAKMIKPRHEASITIQAQMRRFLCTKYMQERRILFNKASTVLQKYYRGWKCRVLLRMDWAAKRIQRFMKLLHFFKFRDAVIMVMQLRRMFLRRVLAAIFVQRVYRGYSGRVFVFNKRYWNIISRCSTQKIQRWYRYHHERRNRKPFVPPGEDWALEQCSKKLARMILELYLDSKRRKELLITMNQSAPQVQRLIRGFLAKKGKHKLSYLRKALRSWMRPYFAVDFMNEFLKNKLIEIHLQKPVVYEAPVIPEKLFLRKFLDEMKQKMFEIDRHTFPTILEQWYESINLPLMQSEKESIIRRFKNPVNGNILIRLLDEYIAAHTQPCRRHGRRICGDCYFHRNCNISGCKCHEYVKNKHHKNGICMRCNHPKNLHSLAPLQVRIAVAYTGEKKAPMLDILCFQSEADMSIPVKAKGVSIDTVTIPLLDKDDIRSEHGRQIAQLVKQRTRERKHEQTTNLVKSLTKGEVEGNTVYDKNQYWKQYSTSAVQPHLTYRPPAKDLKSKLLQNKSGNKANDDASMTSVTLMDINSTVYEKVQFDSHPPNYHFTYREFWDMVAQNPNKTVIDYNEKFDHNIPVPLISHGELVYSFEGPQIYYNIINQLITMEDYIHYDNPIFLKLVMDHIQIFERHWRKMVIDIRYGKLDNKLPISKESRLIFESSNIPRPVLAEKLDGTFRLLGFHKKVLGKDITIRAYAEKKEGLGDGGPLKRKRSLPFIPSEESILSMSRVTSRQGTALSPMKSQSTTDSPSRQLPGSPSRRISFDMARPSSQESHDNSRLTSSPSKSRRTSQPESFSSSTLFKDGDNSGTDRVNTAGSKLPTRRDLLRTLGETFKTRKPLLEAMDNQPLKPLSSLSSAIESLLKPGSRKRRGSHSNAQRPATQEELRNSTYSLTTAPRDKTAYREIVRLNDDRYVCPFPACGQTFLSKDAAIRHMVTHEQKTRLFAATPQSDSHLKFYWPKDVPWLTNQKYVQKTLPPGALRCTHPGCPEIFATQLKLDAHLRLIHQKLNPSAIKLGYMQCGHMIKAIPPDRPVEEFNLPFCHYHAVPTGKCADCMEIENLAGPKPPYQLYENFMVDMDAKEEALLAASGKGGKKTSKKADSASKIRINHRDDSCGVLIHPDEETAKLGISGPDFRARPVFLLVDRNRNAWIGLERLHTMNELVINHKSVPFTLDSNTSKYELFPERTLHDKQQSKSKKIYPSTELIVWVPLHTVKRAYPIIYVPKNARKAEIDSLPIGTYFIRDH